MQCMLLLLLLRMGHAPPTSDVHGPPSAAQGVGAGLIAAETSGVERAGRGLFDVSWPWKGCLPSWRRRCGLLR